MITDLNRFLIAINQKIEKELERIEKDYLDVEPDDVSKLLELEVVRGMSEAYELALKIYHGTDGY